MIRSQPSITGTTHTLPFDKLSPRDFERLCLWLIEREGYERAEHLGAAGGEQGRDLIAWREGALWAFQGKRVHRFGPKDALAEIEKVLNLPKDQRPDGLVFLVTCEVSAITRERARERCARRMECQFWAGTELDERVKRHSDVVQEFFLASPSDLIVYEGVKPVSATDLLAACQVQVEGMLRDVRHKYDPRLYVHRAIENELNDFFDAPLDGSEPNCFLIVAPAGSGKTNLLCELARVRVTRQPVLLLMGGNIYLGVTTGLLGTIQAELEAASPNVTFRSAGDALNTLHRLAEELDQDTLIMLDAINEHDRPVQMRKAIEDLLRKTRGRRIKLVVTCRDYYWGLFKGRYWEGATVNGLPVEVSEDEADDTGEDFSRFAADEHKQALDLYLEHYGITGRPVGEAAAQYRDPLLLRFFCEVYHGQDISEVRGIHLKKLFDRYWDRKLNSIAERMFRSGEERQLDALAMEVGDYLLTLAAYMLQNNVRAVPLSELSQVMGREESYDDPRSIYGWLRDEFIILEEVERRRGRRKVLQVSFVYREFMEYVMARSLIRDWGRANADEARILTEIENLTAKYESFAQIMHVMVYLGLMLKEQRDLALWSLLLSWDERWQAIVFETIRKLPENQLDIGIFDALEEMLHTDDVSVQRQVLDTLKVRRVGQAAPTSVVELTGKLAAHSQEQIRRRAVLALGNMTADLALPTLIKALDDPRRSVRENTVTALMELGDTRAVESLVDILKYGDKKEIRVRAARALGELGDVRAVDSLIAVLKDIDRRVWQSAVDALKRLGDARAVHPLIAALNDSDEGVRRSAVEALKELGDTRAVKPLIAALKDSDWGVQSGAAEALGKLGDMRAEAPLIAALQDSDRRVRSKAAEALEMLKSNYLSLMATSQRFFESAGFELTLGSEGSFFLCQPSDKVWQNRFSQPIPVRIASGASLDADTVYALCQSARQALDDKPTVVFVVIDRTPTDGGWLQIGTMRAEGVQVVPIDDSILLAGQETGRQQQILEKHLRRFLGRNRDLYDVRDPVADRLNFFGREAIASELMELLNEGRPLALFGLRKMGKSSLLKYLREKLAFPTALVDLQAGVELGGLYERILTSWSRSVRVKVRDMNWSPPNLNGATDISSAFTAATRELLAALEDHDAPPRLCLLVDETECIIPHGGESLERYLAFARGLRGLVQEEGGRFSLLLAGVDPLFNRVNRLAGQQNPFYQFFRPIYLPSLERDDCIQMIRNIGRQMGLTYSDEVVAFVADVSGGHPFLARQLCSLAFQRLGGRGDVHLSHLQETARRFIREPGTADLLDENGLWGEISDPDLWPQPQVIANQTVLKSLAQTEPQPEPDLVSCAPDRQACERSLAELERRAVLAKLEQSLFNIHLRLFRSWIQRYQLGME